MATVEGECGAGLPLPESFLQMVDQRPVTVRAELYLTTFGDEQEMVVPVDGAPVYDVDLGLCAGTNTGMQVRVECRTAFRPLPTATAPQARSYSPFPADLRLQPVIVRYLMFPGTPEAVTLSTRDPIGHVRTTVVASDVHLWDYAFGRSASRIRAPPPGD